MHVIEMVSDEVARNAIAAALDSREGASLVSEARELLDACWESIHSQLKGDATAQQIFSQGKETLLKENAI